MNDADHLVTLKHLGHETGIAHIAVHAVKPVTTQLAQPLDHLGAAVAEVVNDHHMPAGSKQLKDGVGADIAGTAGDQNSGCHA